MAKAVAKAQAAQNNNGPIVPNRSLDHMERMDGKSAGPQIIAVPVCEHCGSDKVKIVSSQGTPVNGKRWQRQRYKCDDIKCPGHSSLSVVMRGPFGVNVAGDTSEAERVNVADHRKVKTRPRESITFASGS